VSHHEREGRFFGVEHPARPAVDGVGPRIVEVEEIPVGSLEHQDENPP